MHLDFLNQASNFEQRDNVSPTLMGQIIKAYKSGDYENTLSAIEEYIQQTNSVDVYIVFLSFTCDLYINLSTLENLQEKLAYYESLLRKLSSALSPTKNFDFALGNGIDAFSAMIHLKLSKLTHATVFFEFTPVEVSFKNFFEYCLTLANKTLALKDYKKYVLAEKSLLALKHHLVKLQEKSNAQDQSNESDLDQEATKPDVKHNKKAHEKISAKSQPNNYASIKWYQLIKKVGLLQCMLQDQRLFEAAIVYEDIQQNLEDFDPKDYFPGLFFPLFQAVSANAKSIYKHIEKHSKSLEWHIAKKLYKSDSMRFLRDFPKMVENSYSEEDFHGGDYQDSIPKKENKLIDDISAFEDNKQYKFKNDTSAPKESSEAIAEDIEENQENSEVDILLKEIEEVWDQAGLSDQT